MRKIIITTTNFIEGTKIEKYLDIVCTNLVIGTNVISDFVASVSDFFGGMSGTYREQMQLLYNRALQNLQEKALLLNADAVVGVHIDFDELSGKGKSMFMVSIVGTAVSFASSSCGADSSSAYKRISADELSVASFLNAKFKDGSVPENLNEDDWEFILSHDFPSIGPMLLEYYENLGEISESLSYTEKQLMNYFNQLSDEDKEKIVYSDLMKYKKIGKRLIMRYGLFNPQYVVDLIKNGDVAFAIELLKAGKNSYSQDDLMKMEEILTCLNNLPDKGHYENIKGGFMSSGGEKFICFCGCKNDVSQKYCKNCGMNIKGLTYMQDECISKFKGKIEVLKTLF